MRNVKDTLSYKEMIESICDGNQLEAFCHTVPF